MNYKQVVKNGVLMNKISEYFSLNPHKQSVIIKSDVDGNNKMFWRAVRESNNKFCVTEVNTSTNSFIFETRLKEISAPFSDLSKTFIDALGSTPSHSSLSNALRVMNAKSAQITDPGEKQRADNLLANLNALASATRAVNKTRTSSKGMGSSMPGSKGEGRLYESIQYGKASTLFAQAMAPPLDHVKLSNALNAINTMVGQITDPNERTQVGAMMGALTSAVDATTQGGGKVSVRKSPTAQPAAGKMVTGAPPTAKLTQGRTHSGRYIRESNEFSQASSQFTAAMTPPFDHAKIATSYKQMVRLANKITDPQEKEQMDMMTMELARMADQTAKNWSVGAIPKNVPSNSTKPPPLPKQHANLARFGNRLSEAEKKKMLTVKMLML